jgi:hypothetical protein
VELVLRESAAANRRGQVLAVHYDSADDRKSILVTVVNGDLVVGDVVHVRLGDRRSGGRGTRVQTFAEERFLWRILVNPSRASGHFEVHLTPALVISPGPPKSLHTIAPPAARTGAVVPLLIREEDSWGNVSASSN